MDLLNRFVRADVLLSAVLASSAAACVPHLDSDESTVTGPRVLAVVAEPAEPRPGHDVEYRALFVDEHGKTPSERLTWLQCTASKPLAELGPVSQKCLSEASGALERLGEGHGLKVTGTLPENACSLFGPNPPAPTGEDESPGRPADPDSTGGYKLPIMLGVGTGSEQKTVLYEERIFCGLAGVNPQTSADFALRYRLNANPSVEKIVAEREDGAKESLADGDTLTVKAGERLTLEAHWPSCPESKSCGDGICGFDESGLGENGLVCNEDCGTTPPDCHGQEPYLWFDTQSRELKLRRESLRAAWYGTDGAYDDERTGVSEDKPSLSTANGWTAPTKSGALTLWVVLRDSRGGVGYRALSVDVR